MLINSKVTSKRILYGVGKKKNQLPKIYLPKCKLKVNYTVILHGIERLGLLIGFEFSWAQ